MVKAIIAVAFFMADLTVFKGQVVSFLKALEQSDCLF